MLWLKKLHKQKTDVFCLEWEMSSGFLGNQLWSQCSLSVRSTVGDFYRHYKLYRTNCAAICHARKPPFTLLLIPERNSTWTRHWHLYPKGNCSLSTAGQALIRDDVSWSMKRVSLLSVHCKFKWAVLAEIPVLLVIYFSFGNYMGLFYDHI